MVSLLRSLAIYYGRPGRSAQLKRHYAPFVPQGGLAFDAGAHVGNRSRAFLALGARVVAIEPQPRLARFMRRIFKKAIDRGQVTVEEQALGQDETEVELHLARGNLTVATTSEDWARRAADHPGWENVVFTASTTVRQTTLDALIQRYGTPDFVKIDVEGSEDAVLAGLSRPLPAVSYEFLPADRDVAYRATLRLEHLAVEASVTYEYNFSLGEEVRLVMTDRWWNATELQNYLAEIPDDGPSGDVYARLAGDHRAMV
ncbi:MAG: FkbM family methyltransferase [Alkalispirochaeta sp.]